MIQFKSGLLLLLLLAYVPLLSGANTVPKVHSLYLEEEPRADFTSATVRDRDGFLWIATDNGLKRYDGYHLRIYTSDANSSTAVGSSSINTLMLDSSGHLWVAGTRLSRYHSETDTFTTYDLMGNSAIRALHEDRNGIIWLGGEGFGLMSFDPKLGDVTGQFFETEDSGYIRAIVQHGSTSKLWVGSSGGLYLFDTTSQKVESYPLPLDIGVGVDTIRSLVEDDSGQIWVATQYGLFVLNPVSGAVKHYQHKKNNARALSTDALWSLFKDNKGRIWIGTDKSGVHRYIAATDDFIHLPASLHDAFRMPPAAITDIYQDDEGTLWFSAAQFGAYRVSEHLEKFNSFQTSFDSDNALGFNNVLDLLEDNKGYIWIATDGGGLDRFDPKTNHFIHYKHDANNPNSLSSDSVVALAQDSKGYIWIGTWNAGLNRLDPETGEFKHWVHDSAAVDGQTLANNDIFRIEVDKQDRLYLAVLRLGLQIFDPALGTFELFSPEIGGAKAGSLETGIRSDAINDILPLANGQFWLAGYNGLELFSPSDKTFIAPPYYIGEPISDLHIDHDGFLWVATNKGLIHYNPVANQAKILTLQQGLSDDFVVSVEEDDFGYLWVGTRNGLNRIDTQTLEFSTYDEGDGLASSKFNRFSHLKTRDGKLYFGGKAGFSYFDPVAMPRNEVAPQIHITDLELFQQKITPENSEFLTKQIDYTDSISLPHGQRDITFQFTALNFIAPNKNRYQYRLKGLEQDWRRGDSSRRSVRYTNLSPGTYYFQVLGSNNEGVWAGRAKELKLVILPAWWNTWWAFGLYGLLGLFAMYGFSFWRLRANRIREKELELLVNEQTYKLKSANRSIIQLNSELEQRVAHRTQELSLEIEERRESEAKANYIAYHDSLTELYNRAWLLKHLSKLIISAERDNLQYALFFIGGDRFRKINDTYGHLQGDLLLAAVAKRLKKVLQGQHHAVRLGSDEFVVVIDCIDSQAQVTALAEAITEAYKTQFVIDEVRMNLGVSVGMVVCDASYKAPAQVLRNANIAMQRAKDRGRGIYQMFDEEILQKTLETAAMEADLKLALKRNQFTVVFQPIIVVETGDLNGFEILIRWIHPERGMVPPDKFISMAESSGLIFDIGLWVLSQACVQLQCWREELGLLTLPTISVNLSPVQLGQSDLLQKIDEIFAKTGVEREKIKFEITESALMKNTDTVDQLLEGLRERGIELAIDDFGTGYSSLSYLDKLPVQVLKIDRAFVNALFDSENENGGAHEIVRATISLAHNLKMRVVAEGIETQEQMDALSAYGCDFGQGYMIARPLSAADATDFLVNATVTHLPQLFEK